MSPVDQSRHHVGRAAAVALVGIFVMVVGLFLAAKVISPKTGVGKGKVALGDPTFQAGDAAKKAKLIAKTGPILYADVSGRKDRDMILQHIGEDPDKGWHAFLAAPIDKARDCNWEWQEQLEIFRAWCDRSLTAPANGDGLPQFKVTVTDGSLDVDLNSDPKTGGSSRTTTTTS